MSGPLRLQKKKCATGPPSIFPKLFSTEDPAQLTQETEAFSAYLSGKARTLDLSIQPVGTDFQKKVWNSLMTVPYGETITYSELAALIGYSPKAARSVGTALAANPLLIVQPCHRVVPKSQKPRAFRGGLAMKEQLLSLEKADRL
ncbi:MAG: methylated-DNA--[protein]-cysteine S-methyltransferase [Alkalibacterium sp.]|nr:methylated-DNA--[protein]-cysteine S-methyltransferase [Alkalibacterium sp.]